MIDQFGEHGGHEEGGEQGHEPWDDAAHAAPEDHAAAFGTASYDPHTQDAADHGRLALGEDERLPWLDSADDVDHEPHDSGRMAGFVMLGLLALGALIGGIYWISHSQSPSSQADGSLIEASKAPYKVEPSDAGGKTFQGTGDSSYKVSEGKQPDGSTVAAAGAKAAGSKDAGKDGAADAKAAEAKADTAKADAAKPAAAKPDAARQAAGGGSTAGVGVQVGAFSSHAAAEAAWGKLTAQYSALSGHSHRIVEGKADIGTVYRLQALTGDAGAATALCSTLQGAGLHCQVKP